MSDINHVLTRRKMADISDTIVPSVAAKILKVTHRRMLQMCADEEIAKQIGAQRLTPKRWVLSKSLVESFDPPKPGPKRKEKKQKNDKQLSF